MPRRVALGVASSLLLASAVPHGQSDETTDVAVSVGGRRLVIARAGNDTLAAAQPCVSLDASLDPETPFAVSAAVPVAQPRAVVIGSDEWRQVSPLVLALAERRESEQRLTRATVAKAPRFLDWLFAGDASASPTYYFETSRRVPSTAAPVDAGADTDPPGTLRVVVSGFVQRGPKGLMPFGTKGELRWEQDERPRGPNRPDLRPVGILSLPGGPIWLMESWTLASSTLRFFRVGTAGTTLQATTRLGGC